MGGGMKLQSKAPHSQATASTSGNAGSCAVASQGFGNSNPFGPSRGATASFTWPKSNSAAAQAQQTSMPFQNTTTKAMAKPASAVELKKKVEDDFWDSF